MQMHYLQGGESLSPWCLSSLCGNDLPKLKGHRCLSFNSMQESHLCLFSQAETHLVFPKSAPVDQLKLIRESIAAERDQRLLGGQPVTPTAQAAAASSSGFEGSAASSQPVTSPPSQPSSLVRMFLSLM